MVALSFRAQFADAVENGVWDFYFGIMPGVDGAYRLVDKPHPEAPVKRQTIRKARRDGRDPKAGDTLQLFTGMRTKKCRRLGEVQCREACPIRIEADGRIRHFSKSRRYWKTYSLDGARMLARRDGLQNAKELVEVIRKFHGLPFAGFVIRW
jgi:hypothetical protein